MSFVVINFCEAADECLYSVTRKNIFQQEKSLGLTHSSGSLASAHDSASSPSNILILKMMIDGLHRLENSILYSKQLLVNFFLVFPGDDL